VRRLSGEPDENNSFPNLKTLRDYVKRTGQPIEKFRFDVQVGTRASSREQSKRDPEEYHRAELEERLAIEENSFAADLRGEERPVDPKLNGNGRKHETIAAVNLSMFTDTD
jgi:adenine-specific DNA-methyltransferase